MYEIAWEDEKLVRRLRAQQHKLEQELLHGAEPELRADPGTLYRMRARTIADALLPMQCWRY